MICLAEDIEKLRVNLIDASQTYGKEQETISWFVMQDHQDARAFSLVKRYEEESVYIQILTVQIVKSRLCWLSVEPKASSRGAQTYGTVST